MSNKTFYRYTELAITFVAGALGGLIAGYLASQQVNNARRMPNAAAWERITSQERGHVQANCLINRVESRYWQLFCKHPSVYNESLREHLVKNILPGLALYQVLLEEGIETPDALSFVSRAFRESTQASGIPIRAVARTPAYFPMLRKLTPGVLERSFPEEGFKIEWVENSPQSVAFNIHECYYLKTLTDYGVPELTQVYCNIDDMLYGETSPYVRWERTCTLGRGDEVCDFRWTKV